MIVKRFPTLTTTFVKEQVDGLAERGIDVDLFSVYPSGMTGDLLPLAGKPGHNITYFGPASSRAAEVLSTAWAAASLFRGSRLEAMGAVTASYRLFRQGSRRRAIYAFRLANILRGRGKAPYGLSYDVVHAHMGPMGQIASVLGNSVLRDARLVVTFHGSDVTVLPRRKKEEMYKDVFRRADIVTVNGEFLKRRLIEQGAPPNVIRILPVGAPLELIPFRRRECIGGQRVMLLTVARLEPVKGLSTAIRAMSVLKSSGLNFQYSIVGQGSQEAELKRLVAELDLAGCVQFFGAVPFSGVTKMYDTHDLFILPSSPASNGAEEAQGKVLVEAQAAGMPVVATRCGGIASCVSDRAGILVEPGQADELAEAVLTLTSGDMDWMDMGLQGKMFVEEHFDSKRLVDKLIDIYSEPDTPARETT
jgi:colanic acid/amylovoran biosynthesis glycosyltransferase